MIAIASFLAACNTLQSAVQNGTATIVTSTISADAYQVSAVVEANSKRDTLKTTVIECRQGHGNLTNNQTSGSDFIQFRNVLMSGSKGPDKIFTTLCRVAIPIADKLEADQRAAWNRMTPAERMEAERRNNELLKRLMDLADPRR